MNTHALSPEWDLYADSSGNIAMLTGISAILQDVATAVRLFLAELWYDTTQGVPYATQILAKMPPANILQSQLIAAGMTVPGVTNIVCTFTNFSNRTLSGTLAVTAGSQTGTVAFGAMQGTNGVPWYVSASASAP